MKKNFAPQIIVTIFLLIALIPSNPYGYYILMRWVCFIVFGYLTYQSIISKQNNWAWTLGVIAFIYNPILKFHLSRELWSLINVISIIISLVSIKYLNSEKEKSISWIIFVYISKIDPSNGLLYAFIQNFFNQGISYFTHSFFWSVISKSGWRIL